MNLTFFKDLKKKIIYLINVSILVLMIEIKIDQDKQRNKFNNVMINYIKIIVRIIR